MLTLEGEYPRPLSDITVRAMALYDEKLQAELEPEQIGRGLAIHPASGDYLVADTPTHAGHAMRRLHPVGSTVTLRIGLQIVLMDGFYIGIDARSGGEATIEPQ